MFTLAILRRGVGWLLVAIFLDYATSIAMVIAFGASSEGSAATRTFYEAKTPATFVNLVISQEYWIVIVGFVLGTFLLAKIRVARKDEHLAALGPIYGVGIIIAWLMGAARLARGAPSNLSAFFTEYYGQGAGQTSFYLMASIAMILMLIDFIRMSRMKGRPRTAAVPS